PAAGTAPPPASPSPTAPAPAQQVRQALLVDRVGEAVVGGEAVVDQHPVPVDADHPLQRVGTAPGVDGVARGPVAHPRVQPGRRAADAPAGLVHRQPPGAADGAADLAVGRPQPAGGPQNDLGAGAAGQVDAEERGQAVGDLAVRQAHVLVEGDDGGLGVGAELAGGGSQGVGGLQRVAALGAATAAGAAADVDVEPTADGSARDLGLELLGDAGLRGVAAAVGAGVGQGGVVDLVDLVGGRRRAVGVAAVMGPRLAAGAPGVGPRRPLAEGGGLALAGAALL